MPIIRNLTHCLLSINFARTIPSIHRCSRSLLSDKHYYIFFFDEWRHHYARTRAQAIRSIKKYEKEKKKQQHLFRTEQFIRVKIAIIAIRTVKQIWNRNNNKKIDINRSEGTKNIFSFTLRTSHTRISIDGGGGNGGRRRGHGEISFNSFHRCRLHFGWLNAVLRFFSYTIFCSACCCCILLCFALRWHPCARMIESTRFALKWKIHVWHGLHI